MNIVFNPYWIEKHRMLKWPVYWALFLAMVVPIVFGVWMWAIPGMVFMVGWIALMLYSGYRQAQMERADREGKGDDSN